MRSATKKFRWLAVGRGGEWGGEGGGEGGLGGGGVELTRTDSDLLCHFLSSKAVLFTATRTTTYFDR